MTALDADIGQADFHDWVAQVLRPRSLARVVREDVFDAAMAQARFLPEVIDRQMNQAEVVLAIWDYLDIVATEDRVRRGRKFLREKRSLFNDIEDRFGVAAEIVAAIWGLESAYGANRGEIPTLSALATLAWKGRRHGFFEDELVAALRILQAGHVDLRNMRGSWAGAMGHGQFMPSSFLDFAVDFDGDGRKDIWADDATDALASIANYLTKHGWRRGQPWGYEIRLPDGFDFNRVGLDTALASNDWSRLGVETVQGTALPDYGPGSVLLPAGAAGVALMVLRNTSVLLRYNNAEAYAIGVGLLADRLAGQKGFIAPWPDSDPVLSRDEVREIQLHLSALGFSTQGVDGLRGPNTTRAARRFQADQGLVADGYLSCALLRRLRALRVSS